MILLLLFTVFVGIFAVSRLVKRSTSVLVFLMAFSFYLSLLSLIIYLIKNGHQVMTLGSYFMLPEKWIRRLLVVKLDRAMLTRLLLLGCLLFIGSSITFSVKVCLGRVRMVFYVLLLLPLLVEYLLFEPAIYTRMYMYFYPLRMSSARIEELRKLVIGIFRSINYLYCASAVLLSVWHYLKCRMYRFFRSPLLLFNIGYLGIIVIFLILFGQIPEYFVQISKVTNFTSYKAYNFFAKPQLYSTLPYVSLGFLTITFVAFLRYSKIYSRTQMEEFQLVRDIHNSTLVARTIGHYTKNEMLAIMAEIDCALQQSEEEKCMAMQRIHERCEDICAHLSSIAKTEELSLHMKKTDVLQFLDCFAEKCRKRYPDIEFTEGRIDRAYAMVDQQYFEQALRQLVSNAVDSLRSKESDIKQIRFGLRNVNNWCILSVEDNGKGISKNKINKIFSPFYSTKPEKTNWGLGLSIFYNIIKLHDGHVFIESKVGEKTLFSIFLPSIM